jgi:Ca-activated chloride channel homolog
MKYIRYKKYIGEPADDVDLENLIQRLSDFFLQSGFESQFYDVNEFDPDRSMEALREAIERALLEGDLIPDDLLKEMLEQDGDNPNPSMKELIDRLIERLQHAASRQNSARRNRPAPGHASQRAL